MFLLRTATFPPAPAGGFFKSTAMICFYCAFGAFLLITLVICAFIRKYSRRSAAVADLPEEMTGPLVEDPTLSKECLIMI
jgi:hypothetical protein